MRAFTSALVVIALFTGGCSHSGAEPWRRSVCESAVDAGERERCLAGATRSEGEYERNVEQALERDGSAR